MQQSPEDPQNPPFPQESPGTLQGRGSNASTLHTIESRVFIVQPCSGMQQISGPKHLPFPPEPHGMH